MPVRSLTLHAIVFALVASGSVQPRAQTPQPLPDPATFLQQVRTRLHSNTLLLSQYTYREKETERRYDDKGGVTKTEVTVKEIYPSIDSPEPYERVLSVNGVPIKPEVLARKDRDHQKEMLERAAKLERRNAGDRQRRSAKTQQDKDEEKEERIIDDIFRLHAFTLVGRELMDGQPVILMTFEPRAGVKPRTDEGKFLKKLNGRVWISEADHEVTRLEAGAIEDITLGFGLLARIYKGGQATFERRKVNNEIWLPSASRFRATIRVGLIRVLRVEGISEFSDYRKFTVDTSTTFSPPQPPL